MHPAYRRSLNPPLDRPIWPWVVGGIAAAGLVVGAMFYSRNAQAAVTTTRPGNGNGTTAPGNGTTTPGNGTLPDVELPEPTVVSTRVQDPVTGNVYVVPLASPPARATRAGVGNMLPTPNILLGQRLGFIEAWPTGAEMLWGLVRNVGPGYSFYDVEVAEAIPYRGAYHDVAPTQLHQHQTPSGSTVRVMKDQVIDAIV